VPAGRLPFATLKVKTQGPDTVSIRAPSTVYRPRAGTDELVHHRECQQGHRHVVGRRRLV